MITELVLHEKDRRENKQTNNTLPTLLPAGTGKVSQMYVGCLSRRNIKEKVDMLKKDAELEMMMIMELKLG